MSETRDEGAVTTPAPTKIRNAWVIHTATSDTGAWLSVSINAHQPLEADPSTTGGRPR